MGDIEKYTVIRDTREKPEHCWIFPASKYCVGTESKKLKTGDYTIRGYEDILCIERKGTVAEFAQNITQVRFTRELERMRNFQYAYLLLEFTMEEMFEFPRFASLPKRIRNRIRITGPFILLRYIELTQQYPNMHIILCGNNGQEVARSIFKRVMENHAS